MAIAILIVMGLLVTLGVVKRSQRVLFGATLGVLTFAVTLLYSFGDFPLGDALRLLQQGQVTWLNLFTFAVVAVAVYGGIGALMYWYLRSSIDVRAVQIFFACVFSAAISGMAYLGLGMLVMRGAVSISLGAMGIALATGALVGLVVSFALTHTRPDGCAFFDSRDGSVVISAMAGAVATVGTFTVMAIIVGVLARQPPGPFGMRGVIANSLLGGLLGAGLAVPLQSIRAGRLVRSLVGSLVGCFVVAAVFRGIGGAPVAGLAAGALVGALLPLGTCDDAAIDETPVFSTALNEDADSGYGE